MTWRKGICVSTLLLALWLRNQSAFAQLGVGFGAWSQGGHNTGYGGWFGTSIPPYRNRSITPFKSSGINKQASGYLEGFSPILSSQAHLATGTTLRTTVLTVSGSTYLG